MKKKTLREDVACKMEAFSKEFDNRIRTTKNKTTGSPSVIIITGDV